MRSCRQRILTIVGATHFSCLLMLSQAPRCISHLQRRCFAAAATDSRTPSAPASTSTTSPPTSNDTVSSHVDDREHAAQWPVIRRVQPAPPPIFGPESDDGPPASTLKKVFQLPDDSVHTFQQQAFQPGTPSMLPKQALLDHLPAIEKWFVQNPGLDLLRHRQKYQWLEPDSAEMSAWEVEWEVLRKNQIQLNKLGRWTKLKHDYLSRFGETTVPLEYTTAEGRFTRFEGSLQRFLDFTQLSPLVHNKYVPTSPPANPTGTLYLAQAPLSDLPRELVESDLATPEIVLKAGKGDVYNSSLWLGAAPTYTPLHRDPNPNLFVQLAGQKRIRLLPPKRGAGVFAQVQELIGGTANAAVRGTEMMEGREKKVLEELIWGKKSSEHDGTTRYRRKEVEMRGEAEEGTVSAIWEAILGPGDALFIPLGWWHSVKGVGKGNYAVDPPSKTGWRW